MDARRPPGHRVIDPALAAATFATREFPLTGREHDVVDQPVRRVRLRGPDSGAQRRHLAGRFGRIRQVQAAPDGPLWITTFNRDGRAAPGPGGDRVIGLTLP